MSDSNSTQKRVRSWVAIVYPDSAPSNWRDILDASCIPWCESPLHDKDLDGDGQPKKAHTHILLHFSGKKSIEQVMNILAPLNCPRPQICNDIRGSVRYMAHLDSPHKYQYNAAEIVGHCGFDSAEYLKASLGARNEMISDMLSFIAEKHITEFMDFFVFCAYKRRDTWYPLLCDNCAFIIKEAIKSNRHRGGLNPFIDFDTGETIVKVTPPKVGDDNAL